MSYPEYVLNTECMNFMPQPMNTRSISMIGFYETLGMIIHR
jgi:hypothetical protein